MAIMIADPILLKNYPNDELFRLCRIDGKSDLFYELRLGEATVIALIDTIKSTAFSYWFKFVLVSYQNQQSGSFTVNGTVYVAGVTRERFIDMMMEKYPDHFEWLLFHPEHLK